MYKLPIGVRTPDALLTAPRDKAPVPGYPCTNELAMFAVPMAMSSCDASIDFPFAKALQIAMFSRRAINGTTISPEPRLEIMSPKPWPSLIISPDVSFLTSGMENGGIFTDGSPCGMSPIILNMSWPVS